MEYWWLIIVFWSKGQPLSQPPQTARLTLWEEQRSAKQHLAKLPIPTSEQLAPGHKSEWKLWKSLNRLRTGMGRSKTNMSKWGYADTADTACECGTSEQTMQHLLRCPLLENECSLEDLATANEKALHCARAWPNIWLNSEMMDTKEEDLKASADKTTLCLTSSRESRRCTQHEQIAEPVTGACALYILQGTLQGPWPVVKIRHVKSSWPTSQLRDWRTYAHGVVMHLSQSCAAASREVLGGFNFVTCKTALRTLPAFQK